MATNTLDFQNAPVAGDDETQPNGVTYIYDGVKWSSVGGGSGGAKVSVGTNPPGLATEGDLWFNTTSGIMYVYYRDDDSTQWLDVRPGGSGGIDDAPEDDKQYGRENGTWTETDNIPALPPIADAPAS